MQFAAIIAINAYPQRLVNLLAACTKPVVLLAQC
jgi:hypothetical protein